MALAVAPRYVQNLLLRCVALLGLDIAIRVPGKHGYASRQPSIPRVQFVVCVAADDEEGDALPYLRGPPGLPVEAEVDPGLRGIVPKYRVAFICNHERHA